MRLSILTLLYAAIGGQRHGQLTHAFTSFRHRQIGHVAPFLEQSKTKITNDAADKKESKAVISRRQVFDFFLKSAIPLSFTMASPRPSKAACLSGDVSPECIGFYKVPLLDGAMAKYFDTPEHLAKYAPDLKWVPMTEYPKSYKAAKEELVELQAKLNTVAPMVQKGDFTEAGMQILAIVPRVTVAGRVILQVLQNDSELSMRAMRTENAHLELLASLGAADIVIGQALGGRLGSTTMSQIQILDNLRNAEQEFKELMKAIPENL